MSDTDQQKKSCSKCGVAKSADEFQWAIKGVRRKPACRVCRAGYMVDYYGKNRDKIAAYGAKYYAENRDKAGEYQAAYRAQNREKIATYDAEYRAKNPQVYATKNAVARSPLTEDELFAGATRAEVNAETRFDYILRNLLSEKTGVPYEVDHIKPICEGGVHRIWNLAVIPRSANRTKGAYWADEEYSDEYIEAEEAAIREFNRELLLTES